MTTTSRLHPAFSRLRAAAASAAAALLVGLAVPGCAAGALGSAASSESDLSTAVNVSAGQRIVLRFDAEAVPVTLVDTAVAREFAAQLPLKLELRDPMGQAKSGRLPVPIEHGSAPTVVDPDQGGIYYVPDRAMIAIFYDDLGHTVPAPGLVRLGTIDGGTDAIATAGNRMLVLIDGAGPTLGASQ